MSPKIGATILNDILRCKVGTSQYNNNLMLAKIASLCPFASATCIFNEGGMNLVSNTMMLLASHPLQFVTIIPFKGRWDHISVWNPIYFINACHHKLHHDLVFNEPFFLHFGLVHILSCRCCG